MCVPWFFFGECKRTDAGISFAQDRARSAVSVGLFGIFVSVSFVLVNRVLRRGRYGLRRSDGSRKRMAAERQL